MEQFDAVVLGAGEAGTMVASLATAVGVFPTLQEGMEGAARALLRQTMPDAVAGPLVASPA